MKPVRLLRLALCAVFVMVTTAGAGCELLACFLIESCVRPVNGLDGGWVLTTVNNAPIESYRPGLRVPNADLYIQSGVLRFGTRDWDEAKHTGILEGEYTTVDARGNNPYKSFFNGNFEYHPQSGELILEVYSQGRTLKVTGTTITGSGAIPAFGSVTTTFRRPPSSGSAAK